MKVTREEIEVKYIDCQGCVFEVARSGETVWDFYNPFLMEKAAKKRSIYRMTRILDLENYPTLRWFR